VHSDGSKRGLLGKTVFKWDDKVGYRASNDKCCDGVVSGYVKGDRGRMRRWMLVSSCCSLKCWPDVYHPCSNENKSEGDGDDVDQLNQWES